jgi:hypothetical protein
MFAVVLCAITFLMMNTTTHAQDFLTGPDVIEITAITENNRTITQFPGFVPFAQSFTEAQEPNPFVYVIGTRSGTHNATYNSAVVLTEADGSVSDIVELLAVSTGGVQNWTLNFYSDTESPLQLPTDAFVVTTSETGGLQNISDLFLNSQGETRISDLFNVSVQSDIQAVPEPTTMLLLGSGLLGLWGFRKKLKK